MIVVAFILFAALIAGWLFSPGEVKAHITTTKLEPVATPAD